MRVINLGCMYKHFKGNNYYVEDVAECSETGKEYVVYRDCNMKLFIRPLDMFLSEVDKEKYPDVEQKYRFELIKNNFMY